MTKIGMVCIFLIYVNFYVFLLIFDVSSGVVPAISAYFLLSFVSITFDEVCTIISHNNII